MFLAVNTNSRNAITDIAIKKTDIVLLSWAFMIGSLRYFQKKIPKRCKLILIISKMISQKAVDLFCPKDILEVIRAKINPTITPIKEISRSVFCPPKGSPNHLPEYKIQAIVRTVTRKVKLKNAFIFCLLLNNQETKAHIL